MTDRMTDRIHLTNRQRKKLMPLIMGVEEGGAIIEQAKAEKQEPFCYLCDWGALSIHDLNTPFGTGVSGGG